MKIAIISPRFPPKWIAGTELASYYIAKGLASKGNEVHIITSWDDGMLETTHENGFAIHRIKYSKIRFISFFSFSIKCFRLILTLDPDIVHSQGAGTGFPGILMKYIKKKPCIVWAQGSDIYYAVNLMKLITFIILNQTNQIIALTNDMELEIKKFANRDVLILPNGIDLGRFKQKRSDTYRIDNELKSGQWLLLFVGTLRPVKGVSYLIQAMYILISKGYNNINLNIIGDGEDRKSLEDLVTRLGLTKNVTFIGHLSPEFVPYYMSLSDIFVLPSISEGFPLVILEAMASGLPIITTNVRGLPEIVIDHENGLMVKSKSPNDLADKILEIIHDDKLREEITKNNIQKSYSYSWEMITDRLYNIYLDTIQK